MRAVLRNPQFRRLWFSQVGLVLGDGIMQMGLLQLFHIHGLNVRIETAKLFFAVSLPGLIFGPIAVAYLDKWQRRTVLIFSDAIRAVTVVAMAAWLRPVLLGKFDPGSLFVVYALMFVIGAITTFHYPARYALVPNLVETSRLIQANTLFTASLAVTGVVSRALGGVIAVRLGVESALLANAVAYVASIALLSRIYMKPHATTQGVDSHKQGGWGELKAGFVYLKEHSIALPLVIICAAFAFLAGASFVAIIGYADQRLHLGTAGIGYLAIPAGLGAGFGIIMIGRAPQWSQATRLPFIQLFIAGIALMLLSVTTNLFVVAVLLFAFGAIAATILIPIDAKLQTHVDDKRRGAVFAARGMFTSATMVIAFWLNFGTAVFRDKPASTILLWLGLGAATASLLALTVKLERRS